MADTEPTAENIQYNTYAFASYNALDIQDMLSERKGAHPDLETLSLNELDRLLEHIWRRGYSIDHNTDSGILETLEDATFILEQHYLDHEIGKE